MQPLMPKATAVWLVDNTTLTFDQISEFVGLHPLEIAGIADGEVAVGIKGFDPIAHNQLAREEIERCEKNPSARLKLRTPVQAPKPKKKPPRYTPLSKRQERPAAIAWLVRNHPELADAQICKLLGTTKQTIEAIRNKTHWNSNSIQPVDPVALGLCRQIDLDAAVSAAAEKRRAIEAASGKLPPAGGGLMPVEESLTAASAAEEPTPTAPNPFGDAPTPAEEEEKRREPEEIDPDALFNLPAGGGSDDDEEDPMKP